MIGLRCLNNVHPVSRVLKILIVSLTILLAFGLGRSSPKSSFEPLGLTALEVVDALRAAGLQAEGAVVRSRLATPNYESADFVIPAHWDGTGNPVRGSVQVLRSRTEYEATLVAIGALGRSTTSDGLGNWHFARGNVVLTLGNRLPAEAAVKYEVALQSLSPKNRLSFRLPT